MTQLTKEGRDGYPVMDSERTTSSRRGLLAALGAGTTAALAGCSALGSKLPIDSPGDDTATDEPTDTETETPVRSPDAVPTYPYEETGVEALAAEPDPLADNPVFSRYDLREEGAQFVADPFLFVTEEDEWHMFFEMVVDKGVIVHATSPDRGVSWDYQGTVLEQSWHLSFPYVFKWDGEYYMTTEEGHDAAKPRLYRAESFPDQWTEETILYDPDDRDHGINDHVLFRWDGRWWNLAGAPGNHTTYVYHADSLTGDWQPHANNPVVTDRKRAARPGGRPIVRDDHVLVYFQDCVEFYGDSVRAYRVTDLSPDSYADEEVSESPVISGTAPSSDEATREWNSLRMHQYDAWYLGEGEGWRVAVDGDGTGSTGWSVGIYHVPEGGGGAGSATETDSATATDTPTS